MARLTIKLVRSVIGYERDQRRTVQALGLRRMHQTVEHEDTPTIRGMLHKVRHMVLVAPADSNGLQNIDRTEKEQV